MLNQSFRVDGSVIFIETSPHVSLSLSHREAKDYRQIELYRLRVVTAGGFERLP